MKDDRLRAGRFHAPQSRERRMLCARDVLARPFVGLAHVDQDGAFGDELPRRGGIDDWQGPESSFPRGSSVRAIESVKRRKQRLDPFVRDPVPDGLGLAPEGDDPLLPHACEMLGQRRLRQADFGREIADSRLPHLHELAEDEQAPVIGERRKDARHFAGFRL